MNAAAECACNDYEVTYAKDDDTLIEKCWEEQYRNDSKKWLIRDGSSSHPPAPFSSTMKDAYTYPLDEQATNSENENRRAILLQKFRHEATAEIIREINEPPPVEEYRTEYVENYNMAGFQPEKIFCENNSELSEKYPLYSSSGMSFYKFNYTNNAVVIDGVTKTIDPKYPFKKNVQFSKPLSELLDEQHR